MMASWVIFTVLAALLYTFVNIFDKYIIDHEMKDPIMATVLAGSSCFLLFTIVGAFVADVMLPLHLIIVGILIGVVYNVAIWIYYSTIKKEEVSVHSDQRSLLRTGSQKKGGMAF